MIRDGRFGDGPRIADMLAGLHARSRYADVCKMDPRLARSLVMQSIQRHGGTGAGATCVFVSEDATGTAQGFLIGVLQPLYLLGDRLEAQDVFFHCSAAADPADAARLVEAFTGWAECNPDVAAIKLSATDVVDPTARVEKLFRRKGYRLAGVIYERNAR